MSIYSKVALLVHQKVAFMYIIVVYLCCVLYFVWPLSDIPLYTLHLYMHLHVHVCMQILVTVLLFPLLCTERHSTVGIQCDKWVYRKSGAAKDTSEITFYTWDFAGQVGFSLVYRHLDERHALCILMLIWLKMMYMCM